MRVLVLDDDDDRHTAFSRSLIGHEQVAHVRTFDEFKAALEEFTFDVMYLDHDLNMYQYRSLDYSASYGGPIELTGADCARLIAGLEENRRPTRCVVHSFNPDGAKRMIGILRDAGIHAVYVPFCRGLGEELKQDDED